MTASRPTLGGDCTAFGTAGAFGRKAHADVFNSAKRSQVMSKIRGRGNKNTELALAALPRRHRLTGWRRHEPVFGKPDFVCPKVRVAILVNGCFWHGCPRHSKLPVNNRAFWKAKLEGNTKRDRLVGRTLYTEGWRVLRVWEHDLSPRCERKLIRRIERVLTPRSG